MSPLEALRLAYQPKIPSILNGSYWKEENGESFSNETIDRFFPKTSKKKRYALVPGKGENRALRVGVVFSGGPAAGGHNVIWGLWDALHQIHSDAKIFGFLDGPSGILEGKYRELKENELARFKNQGGFDWIGSGRTKIETPKQMEEALQTCQTLGLNGLLIIGGDDSNTNAAILAEYFLEKGIQTSVIGIPKTIDGDLRSDAIEIPFGFDSATKTYAELIGNIAKDALSTKKYYHFIRLMGRSASHITLECALKTQPNLALIGEERKSLQTIVEEIADLISRRRREGKDYGVILIPEGLFEFMPEMSGLIEDLSKTGNPDKISSQNKKTFDRLPLKIQKQLLSERDPHGNLNVSLINTEELLIEEVTKLLKKQNKDEGAFRAQHHFFGYEGRCSLPTNFDATYCYTLGQMGALAIRDRLTGVIGAVQKMTKPINAWVLKMIPILELMHMEMRKGKEKPVIKKYLVDKKSPPFVTFSHLRTSWEMEDLYLSPGPIQFFGDSAITDSYPKTITT